jgi:predicted amino acid racemase
MIAVVATFRVVELTEGWWDFLFAHVLSQVSQFQHFRNFTLRMVGLPCE